MGKTFKISEESLWDYNIIKIELLEHDRWSVLTRYILEHEEGYYEVFVNRPATEQQEGADGSDEEFEAREVHKVKKEVEVWEVVE